MGRIKAGQLTPKQNKFITVYLATGNATEAYRQAYNCENMKPETINRVAHDQLKNSKIAARLNKVEEKAFEEQVDLRTWVLTRLKRNAAMAMGEAPIPYSVTKDGETTSKTFVKVDHNAASKALELLGKTDGVNMFIDRSEVDVQTKYAGMSDEELDDYIAERLDK